LHALDLKSGKIVWSAKPSPCVEARTNCSPAQSAAVTAIPGVVFSGSIDGHLRAYSTATGAVIWDVDTAHEFETVNGKPARGGSMDVGGPAVVNGMVFVNSGYGQWGGMPGNVLLAFSVDGK
jgi:polyvinyl alcohol dehydrogenase (cytochrome)